METRKYDKILAIAKRRGFVWPSSEIYGGLGGFFDYGPIGAVLKRNIENEWRKIFIIREGMFEIDTPTLMPEDVFKASGHLEHFKDFMAVCKKCGYTDKVGELEAKKESEIRCSKCKGPVELTQFKLMFKTKTGAGKVQNDVYLRPETAQGMFIAFPRLKEVARKKLPFGVCQIGRAYRNEISPRQGMIRLREFTQAEVEVFYNPNNKTHENFKAVENEVLPLYPKKQQEKNKPDILEMKAKDSVKKGLIKSELQAYYLALSKKFFDNLGTPKNAIRCRQQLQSERAHYSIDTWDIEIKSEDFGWVEVCAVADRTDYDLKGHSTLSKQSMEIYVDGKKVLPHVMEASFGVDRPFYCVLEHSYKEVGKRTFFNFKKEIAPIKVGVFPLVSKDNLPKKAKEVYNLLIESNVMAQYDESGSIGRRYARADEIGIPQCVTIDYDTLKDNTVTIRERNTTKQERVKIKDLSLRI